MDVETFRAINLGWRNPICDTLFAALSYSALGEAVAIVAIVLVCSKSRRPLGLLIAFTAILGGTIFAQSFKTLLPRDRPSNQTYAIVQEPHKKSSFPSGHTATAFSVATALGILAGRKRKWLLVDGAYLWAVGVGLSRIYRGVHWPTDVAGGALLGITAGCLAIILFDALTRVQSIESQP